MGETSLRSKMLLQDPRSGQEGIIKLVSQGRPVLEMPLHSTNVFDYEGMQKHNQMDTFGYAIKKALKVLRPEERQVSILLLSQRETILVVFEDDDMRRKAATGIK